MRGPLDVVRELLAADLPHEIVHLPRRVESARELPDALGVAPAHCVSVEVFETDAGYVAALVPVDALVGVATLARLTGSSSVRRADVATVNRVTDFTAMLVPPIGLPETLPVLADSRLATDAVAFTATGDSGTALKIRGNDLIRAAGAGMADLAEAPPPEADDPTAGPGLLPLLDRASRRHAELRLR